MVSASQLQQACVVSERSESPVIKAQRLAYAIFQRPDLDEAERFFCAFGLLVDHRESDVLYFRGRTEQNIILVVRRGPHDMIGLGIVAATADLQCLSEETGSAVRMHKAPMAGSFITLTDPDGMVVEVCSGLRKLPPIERSFETAAWNSSDSKERVGRSVRVDICSHLVEKLGHSVVGAAKIKDTAEWYQNTLGMIVSDFQFIIDDPVPVVAFLRFDNGDVPSDHHSFGIASVIEKGHVHSAFEMDSIEQIAIGGEWLRENKYKHSWGIGRHILGSQIFDYWREPNGDLFEHYSDGDVFDASKSAGYHMLSAKAQHQWGPSQTKEFTGEDKPWNLLKSLARRIPADDDLSVSRVRRLLKSLNS